MTLMQTIQTDWNIVKADFKGFIAKVGAAVVWLDKEAPVLIALANKVDPAVGAALALIIHAGELAAETLAEHAKAGLDKSVEGLIATSETSIANAIQDSGLDVSGKTAWTAADVAIANKLRATYHAAVDANFAKVLAALAPKTAP